jgi:flagellar M-ring protein FliF
VGQIIPRLIETWNSLSPARKGMLTATGVALVALLFMVNSWAGRTEYVTLYSSLDASDSGAIVEQLRTQGIPYELGAGGATVRVPASRADDLRLDFATQGLPQGGQVGFEIFEGSSFTATDFVQRLNYQRGLQGELARTIGTFPAVENARVHLALPERSLFVDDQSPATASVVVSLRAGGSLAANEVSGIAHLVSGAVEGLSKENITVLDASGQILYDGQQMASADGMGLSGNQLTLQQEYERRLETDVQSMLDRALGPAKSAVSVSALLNFNKVETQRESYSAPEDGTPRSSSTVQESYTTSEADGNGQIPGALANVPGANANLPTVEDSTALTGTGTVYSRAETTSNFEVDKTTTYEVEAPGRVERLSVSLLLDDSVSAELADSLLASVAAAVGIDTDRGDAVVVSRLPFDRSALDEAQAAFAATASTEQLFGYVRMALPVLMLVVGFLFFRMLLKSVNQRSVRAFDTGAGRPALAMAGGAMELGDPVGVLRALPQPDEVRRSDLEVSIERMARTNPESISEVVQAWLRED